MKRYLEEQIVSDLKKKMVFLTGPRQVGKTFLAKSIMEKFRRPVYLNYDDTDHFKVIKEKKWRQDAGMVILDEVHKMKSWKKYLKGVYDTKTADISFLVTGSARLDTFRQTGESLAGRYFSFRLNPFSVKELAKNMKPYDALTELNERGGFPEPFLSGSSETAARWRRQYYTDIVREDIMDFSRINEIHAMKILLELLRKRTGSPISYKSMAEDLQVSPNTVKHYIEVLEALHIIFVVRPFHNNIARAILKEPKIYFYDSGYVDNDEGAVLENTAAVCLLKHVQFLQDVKGENIKINYLRTKDKKEVDFVLVKNGVIEKMIEVKLSDTEAAGSLKYFKKKFVDAKAVQLVHNISVEKREGDIDVYRAGEWMAGLEA